MRINYIFKITLCGFGDDVVKRVEKALRYYHDFGVQSGFQIQLTVITGICSEPYISLSSGRVLPPVATDVIDYVHRAIFGPELPKEQRPIDYEFSVSCKYSGLSKPKQPALPCS